MNKANATESAPAFSGERLRETQIAFDSVAADYDGPRGNNDLIQEMRTEMWRWLDATFCAPNRLIDLGCGTGLDAVRMGQLGHHVTATDWAPLMVQRATDRAARRVAASYRPICSQHRAGGNEQTYDLDTILHPARVLSSLRGSVHAGALSGTVRVR